MARGSRLRAERVYIEYNLEINSWKLVRSREPSMKIILPFNIDDDLWNLYHRIIIIVTTFIIEVPRSIYPEWRQRLAIDLAVPAKKLAKRGLFARSCQMISRRGRSSHSCRATATGPPS